MLVALRQGFRADADVAVALSICSDAAALGLPAHTLAIGSSADLIAVDAETPGEAVANRPTRRLVYLNEGPKSEVSESNVNSRLWVKNAFGIIVN